MTSRSAAPSGLAARSGIRSHLAREANATFAIAWREVLRASSNICRWAAGPVFKFWPIMSATCG